MHTIRGTYSSQSNNIFLIMAFANNVPCYFYIRAKSNKIPFLRRLEAGSSFKVTDYGDILESGYGEVPHPMVKTRMEEQYNFSEDQ